ncbi:MAG: sulfite exporter TauE/SafE family protein [Marinovum sp.]|nr:sulfite exporter TauE/SafE family protein [Marinovum sp.]
MELIWYNISPSLWVYAFMISVCAGLIKGIVGFAMPMITISGLSLILPPELALAGLILPTLLTNGVQALAQGPKAAFLSMRQFGVFLLTGLVFLLASAQLVTQIPAKVFLGGIGIMVVSFSVLQLSGYRFQVRRDNKIVPLIVGSLTGFVGGLSGVWGPPTVAYLTAMNTKKEDQLRVQGVVYGLGAVALLFAHIASGILTWSTAQFSALLVPPSMVGLWIGRRFQKHIDQALFSKATLAVLVVAGLNLLRLAWMG